MYFEVIILDGVASFPAKSRENFPRRPELIFYIKTSCTMMVWTIARILRDTMEECVNNLEFGGSEQEI